MLLVNPSTGSWPPQRRNIYKHTARGVNRGPYNTTGNYNRFSNCSATSSVVHFYGLWSIDLPAGRQAMDYPPQSFAILL
jgi:hypothetical protein